MIKREILRNKNVVFSGRIITVRNDEVIGTTGKPEHREVVLHGGGVAVVPLVCGDVVEVILVRQYRYCLDEETLEIPAGKLEGSDPLERGQKELSEETGASGDFTYLGKILASPGFSNEVIHLYMADNLTFHEAHPDEGEEVETVRMPLAEALKLIERGEIIDGKTVAALLMADRLLTDKGNK